MSEGVSGNTNASGSPSNCSPFSCSPSSSGACHSGSGMGRSGSNHRKYGKKPHMPQGTLKEKPTNQRSPSESHPLGPTPTFDPSLVPSVSLCVAPAFDRTLYTCIIPLDFPTRTTSTTTTTTSSSSSSRISSSSTSSSSSSSRYVQAQQQFPDRVNEGVGALSIAGGCQAALYPAVLCCAVLCCTVLSCDVLCCVLFSLTAHQPSPSPKHHTCTQMHDPSLTQSEEMVAVNNPVSALQLLIPSHRESGVSAVTGSGAKGPVGGGELPHEAPATPLTYFFPAGTSPVLVLYIPYASPF